MVNCTNMKHRTVGIKVFDGTNNYMLGFGIIKLWCVDGNKVGRYHTIIKQQIMFCTMAATLSVFYLLETFVLHNSGYTKVVVLPNLFQVSFSYIGRQEI